MRCLLLYDDDSACRRWATADQGGLGAAAVTAEWIDGPRRQLELEASLSTQLSEEDRVLLVTDNQFQTAGRSGWEWARRLGQAGAAHRSFHYAVLSAGAVTVPAKAE